MTARNPRKSQESALGKGLDALIRKDYLDEEKQRLEEKKNLQTEETEHKIDIDGSEIAGVNTGSKEAQNVQKDTRSTEITQTPISETSNIDDKIVEDVLMDVYKNPRISLWSARSAAVLRFLKKTKPEFSISNEASLLIEAAVKDRHPDIWKMFEEKGL